MPAAELLAVAAAAGPEPPELAAGLESVPGQRQDRSEVAELVAPWHVVELESVQWCWSVRKRSGVNAG